MHALPLQLMDVTGPVTSTWKSCACTASALPAMSKARYLIVSGDDSNALNMDTQNGLGGMRIFRPFKSSGVVIGRVPVVIWR